MCRLGRRSFRSINTDIQATVTAMETIVLWVPMHFGCIISAQMPLVPFLYTDFSSYFMLELLNSQVVSYLIIYRCY